ncbi:MAG: imidazole glycerol phosphate synthase cyclase subunit [Synechococcales bacterium]|nr:imidazole glycerol phosphate synthase cyclase subunit [Synechococcales bacterium]
MLKTRLIPVLLLKNGLLVRSEGFHTHQIIGNPVHEVKRFNEWNVDELIYLDISRDDDYDLRRDDHKIKDLTDRCSILEAVSKTCFMPLTWGGRIRSLDEIRNLISHGADKVTLNTAAVTTPTLITEAAAVFGSQAIVVSLDVKREPDGKLAVWIEGGKTPTGLHPVDWARKVEQLGAGEILLNSIDRDGTGQGYDLALIQAVAAVTTIPIIACGGVGRYEHYAPAIAAGASAVAAANIWHFRELSDRGGKRALSKAGIPVR